MYYDDYPAHEDVWGLEQVPKPPFMFSPEDLDAVTRISWFIRYVFAPLLIAIGCLGNAFVVAVMSRSRLIKKPPMTIFTAIAVNDIIFLLSLSLVLVGRLSAKLTVSVGWCESVNFLSMSAAFLSVWYHFLLISERYMTHCADHIRSRSVSCRCRPTPYIWAVTTHACTLGFVWTSMRTKVAVIFASGVAIIVHLNLSVTVGYVVKDDYAFCAPGMHMMEHLVLLNQLDLAFNVALPYTVMAILLLRLIVEMFRKIGDPQQLSAEQKAELIRQRSFTRSTIALCVAFLLCNAPSQLHRVHLTNPDNHPPFPLPFSHFFASTFLHALFCARIVLTLPVLLVTSAEFRKSLAQVVRGVNAGAAMKRRRSMEEGANDNNDANDSDDNRRSLLERDANHSTASRGEVTALRGLETVL